ncbi:NF041680 family putative transposase [Carbonactinospora thermoautotrophica]|uniref:NF041680 family putative transposase n=1 Tax=Carbonactinospora thermoautotrophica TaxID=1469144 RepID=UPI000AD0786C|nr:NF041680 family putative transposase [Carbonactinospora thermoautotrophica]
MTAIVDYPGGLRLPAPPRRDARAALVAFRRGWYGCLRRRRDALFELGDALLGSAGPVTSLPHLSLEPLFRRGHGSLYAALAEGDVDTDAVRDLLAAHRPAGWPPVFAVDASTWVRCDAETSPGRGFYYHPSRHSAGQPIVAGWSYQWVAQLSWRPDSWTAPVDVCRIHPHEDAVDVTVRQVTAVAERLAAGGVAQRPLFVFDAGYDPIALSEGLAGQDVQILVRIRADRVFYADPPPRLPGVGGRPRRHGARFACADPATWPPPTAQLTCRDTQYGTVTVRAWSGLHPKLAGRGRHTGAVPPIVPGTIVRVQVQRLPTACGRNKALWLWWAGSGSADLDVLWRAYVRRFDIEHTLRFVKNTLGWVIPAVRTPEQADRWTWIIVAAYTQLRLARTAVADQRLPWERPLPPTKLTPTRVRRGFLRLHPAIGTPASPPKPSGRGPGRPKGSRTRPAQRHPAIKKTHTAASGTG